MNSKHILFIILYQLLFSIYAVANNSFLIKGRVTETDGKTPIAYTNIILTNALIGTQTDDNGYYQISVSPGFYQLKASSIGYRPYTSFEFRISTSDYTMNIKLEKDVVELQEINVTGNNTVRKNADAPLSLQIIKLKEIEKIPGANRDISKVISSFAGVATPTLLYRNDILVRGGGPSENKFYLDGIEIPNINHFATQGASGGPVGILNADLLREVDFYSGGFPVTRENGISSVLDFKLKDGSANRRSYKFTVGASEAGISSNGYLSSKTSYLVSARYSYLQFLFSLLKLPFLPQYIDSQFKIKTRFNANHELTILGIGAIDDMKLNNDVDPDDEDKYLLLITLPKYKQKTYTIGAVYKHYQGNHVQTIALSNSLLRNSALKYIDNIEKVDNLRLDYNSDEAQTRLRFENSSRINCMRIIGGASVEYATYTNQTLNNIAREGVPISIQYHSYLDMIKYSVFGSFSYQSADNRFSASTGIRFDASNYSSFMSNPLRQFAPRAAFSFRIFPSFYLNLNGGRYYQLPLYTAMGYKNKEGEFVNKDHVRYFGSDQISGGLEYRPDANLKINFDGFYKKFFHGLTSFIDSIPLASLGNDYGVIGDEEVRANSTGKAYGFELSDNWSINQKLSLISSYTCVRSLVKDLRTGSYVPSSWDSRHIFTASLMYSFPRNWDAGVKFRALGGSPYTPVDTEHSSLVQSWNRISKSTLDYAQFNSKRLKPYTQLDIRIDKTYYWKNKMIGLYIDIQNLLNQKYKAPKEYISTGVIENPDAPLNEQHYRMKWLNKESGTILPTLGLTIEI